MTQETENNAPKASAFSKITKLSAVILLLAAALVIACLFLYINIIRSPEMLSTIEDSANLLTHNFLGSPLLILDVIYIAVSLVFIATIFSIIFRWKKNRNADSRNIYVNPVSSEIIEEKDRILHRDKSVIDTTKEPGLLDIMIKNKSIHGFYGTHSDADLDKLDSDGDRE